MTTGMLRVKNESRWIERCIRSIQPLCDRILVMDDHSDDETPDIVRRMGVTLIPSPFDDLCEGRDKNWLLNQCRDSDWIICIDGDEELAPGGVEILRSEMTKPHQSLSLDVLYLWDREDQVRVDGVYGEFLRQSVFRPGQAKYDQGEPPNFHCGNVPLSIRFPYTRTRAKLLHYGYLHSEDRLRKYRWYNQTDPNNAREDGYRHVVIGDMFPVGMKTKYAGPLKLRPLSEVL